MRMLAIPNGPSLILLAALQQERISPPGDANRVEAEHRAGLKPAAAQVVAGHQHSPVEAAELRVAARAALCVELAEHEPV